MKSIWSLDSKFLTLFSIASLFGVGVGSISTRADELPHDPASIIQRPEIPAGVALVDLPNSSRVGRNFSSNCFASYLIEKFAHRRHPRDREIFYDIRVTNIGSCVLADLVITDFFPDDAFLEEAHPGPNFFRRDSATWTLPWLGLGGFVWINLEFHLAEIDGIPSKDQDPDHHDGQDHRGQDHHPEVRRITNTACVWSPMVGQQACATVSTLEDEDRGDQDQHPHPHPHP